ncbi:hypothetical protein HJ01_02928 [Flavobacterium frigoris PS1]|uniref:Uncharacterized protein n=1 Tax=Flavobacterium frigoris (strain PS1) TaxID=1086011 RepID=H7FUT0_FLAFP|nr:hypothetical protein HJ01_02928 [Flavobacterium frigoris PS1]
MWSRKTITARNSRYTRFGHLAEFKNGFVFGNIWQIRRMGLI